jgi:RNA polymerase sigma factor (sigma-70 family)
MQGVSSLTMADQDRLLAETIQRDEPRLRSFIRKRVLDMQDAEDVLQDVLYELIEAYRLMKPAEQVTAWLDLFRRRKAVSLNEAIEVDEDGPAFEDLLPSPDDGPDAIYARKLLFEAMEEALAELPKSQREVFVAHELLGRSFKELAAETGVSMNTLLSRKRYAVLHLRKRLQEMDERFGR